MHGQLCEEISEMYTQYWNKNPAKSPTKRCHPLIAINSDRLVIGEFLFQGRPWTSR